MKYNEISESTNIFDLNPKLENLLYNWYGGQTGRDKFLELNIPAKYKVPPKSQYVYRYVDLKPEPVAKLLFDKKSVQLNSKYKTSSWTPKKSIVSNHSGRWLISVAFKKQIKNKDIIIYTPNIAKYHRAFVRGMDNTARDAMLEERELIIRNTPYWLTIKPDEIVFVQGEDIKQFIHWAGDYYDEDFLRKRVPVDMQKYILALGDNDEV